jgi:outer membrane protein
MLKKVSISFSLLLLAQFSFAQKKWTLQECVTHALKNNITIKQTALDLKTAQLSKKDVLGSFMPNVSASTSHSWNIGLNQDITTGLLENQTTQFTSLGLNANIALYNGLQNQNKLRRAKLQEMASQLQLSKMQDDISLNIANAYLQILFNKENLNVQKEQLSNNEKQLQKTQETVNAGVLPRGDLLDAKATVAADNQRVIAAENNLFLSKLSLAQLLQLDQYKDFDIADADYDIPNSTVMQEKPETIIEKAKQERVELKIAKANLDIAEKEIAIAKGAYQPSLNGFYSFSTRASYSDRIVGVDSNGNPVLAGPLPFFDQLSQYKGHNFGVSLNIPIFNGFAVKNNVERTKINAERTKNNTLQTEQDLEKNIFTAITNAKGALNTYEASLAALEARKEAYAYAKEKFDVGMMNSFDFNQAQMLYANAQSEVLRTKYDYIFKIKVVEFYFGIPIVTK